MIARFFRWWFSELSALVPGSGRARRAESGQWLVVDVDAARVRVRIEGRGARDLAEVAADAPPAVLESTLAGAAAELDPRRLRCRVRVDSSQALSREIELPLAAEENLREVLAFEMDRQTPFRAEDVYFEHRVVERDERGQRLRARLRVVRRAQLDPLLVALRDWALEPSTRPAPRRADERVVLDFVPAAYRERPEGSINAVLALVVLALAGGALALLVAEQRADRERLERELDRARTAAAEAVAVRERLDASRAARRWLFDAKADRVPMVELLEALSRALPDDTYLFRVEISGSTLSLHGSSGTASSLIGILEARPEFEGVEFASPLTRDGSGGRERFHISARLADRAPGGTG